MIRSAKDSDWDSIERIYNATKLDELRFDSRNFVLLRLREDFVRFTKLYESAIIVHEAFSPNLDGDMESRVVAFLARFENEIRGLYVEGAYRNQGLASNLLEYTLSDATSEVSLSVAKSNVIAQRLYKSFGFSVSGEFLSTYNGVETHALTMVRCGDQPTAADSM
ncbi:hypothetical protein NBRC116583_27190 [Arenicella sp. 4NH20-0111]|uniref:GNAT family N-acetyltransferase n=1 Tax=Arenicella sp. 4NH20-0111 TaxID=3127648 RepID=UPI0031043D8E